MEKLNGTVTLSILEEDNSQRVIFRIIPLCTKDGLIFQNRKTIYPDFGSLRIIPDKREQSSFKERMRAIGSLCCVQLFSAGKELTKIRQNRNYDPNQGECNQYAIYSDVVCGFERDAVFEVFQEGQDHAQALSDNVLLQRGKVLYGPIAKDDDADWDALKPFGNEEYLLHTVEDLNGNDRTYYWNPENIITWRQRKKANKQSTEIVHTPQPKTMAPVPKPETSEKIPIGTKLEILDHQLTNDEQITELNLPVSDDANRLENKEKPKRNTEPDEAPHFHGTPIGQMPTNGTHGKTRDHTMHGVVEKQLLEKQSANTAEKTDRRPVTNPMEDLKTALQEVIQIQSLHPKLIRLLGENRIITEAIVQASIADGQTNPASSIAKAELDVIEAERLALLVELDKIKANYQQTKEKMYSEFANQKQAKLNSMEKQLDELKAEKIALEDTLKELGDQIQKGTAELLASKAALMITSNGSDLTISPTVGYHMGTRDIIEALRLEMNNVGFICKPDCVTEFLVFLSLFDEICLTGDSMSETESYIKFMLGSLGLHNVTAWPSVFGTLHIVSILPENDLRTPTIEVIKNDRTPIRAFGHKTIRMIERGRDMENKSVPLLQVPKLNKERGQDDIHASGKPISLQTLNAFSQNAEQLYKDGEAWFDTLKKKLDEADIEVPDGVLQNMRTFARITTPRLHGGFSEAADAAAFAWIVPILIQQKFPKERLVELIGDLPRCMQAMVEEMY